MIRRDPKKVVYLGFRRALEPHAFCSVEAALDTFTDSSSICTFLLGFGEIYGIMQGSKQDPEALHCTLTLKP